MTNKHLFILLFLAGNFINAFSQNLSEEKYTLSGYLSEAGSGEKLISARIYDARTGQGTLSNNFGFYSLTLPAGEVQLVVASAGYSTLRQTISLTENKRLDLSLENYTVDEVTIVAENETRIEEKTEMSTVDIPIKQIKLLPALLGEVDVIKAIQLMPGVQSGNEGSTGLYVRGGGPDQNLILLDDVPLYYVSHLGGFFSVFNADALNSVKLTKGGFPARYGGRLSSVLDIRMKEGNMEEFQGEGSIGLISSKLSIQGPINKGKTSFIISGRRTYIDLLSRPISKLATKGQSSFGYHFYDLNAKINHIISDKDRLYLSGYMGDDNLGIKTGETNGQPGDQDYSAFSLKNKTLWGNKMGALRWNHIWGPKIFSNLTTTYSNYRFNSQNEVMDAYAIEKEMGYGVQEISGKLNYKSGIEDVGGKVDIDIYPNPSHSIKLGLNTIYHTFTPGLLGIQFKEGETELDTTISEQRANSLEMSGYIEDEFKIGNRFSANLGLHGVRYQEKEKVYYSLQPRISARMLLSRRLSFKASYVQMTQFIHLLANSGAGLPIDLWVPATDRVPPQQSWQAAAGIATSFLEGQLELSVEGYYKEMTGLIEYKEGTDFFLGVDDGNWEDRVETGGTGTAYGLEVLLQKKQGKTTGWIGYTLSWNKRQFDNINGGKIYPFKYDRRHDVSVVAIHQLSEKITLSGTWVFGTGNAITLPSGGYGTLVSPFEGLPGERIGSFANLFYTGGFSGGGAQLYENGRNGFRMQPYHRLDLGVNFTKKKKWGERTWTISIYNVYSRLNPYSYNLRREYDSEAGGFVKPTIRKIALFPIIPSLSYAFKF